MRPRPRPRPRPGGPALARLRALVLDAYGPICHLCHEPIPLDVAPSHPRACQLDHLLPHADGGEATLENLRPAHASCNQRRGLATLTPAARPLPAAEFFKPSATRDEASRPVLPPAGTKTAPTTPAPAALEAAGDAPIGSLALVEALDDDDLDVADWLA